MYKWENSYLVLPYSVIILKATLNNNTTNNNDNNDKINNNNNDNNNKITTTPTTTTTFIDEIIQQSLKQALGVIIYLAELTIDRDWLWAVLVNVAAHLL